MTITTRLTIITIAPADNHEIVYCLLLATITVTTTMVIIVAMLQKQTNNYDQLLVNKSPTDQETRNCHDKKDTDNNYSDDNMTIEIITTKQSRWK